MEGVGRGGDGVAAALDGWNEYFFFQAEDGIRDRLVTGVQTCALPISVEAASRWWKLLPAGGS